jgi:hypothetical protein
MRRAEPLAIGLRVLPPRHVREELRRGAAGVCESSRIRPGFLRLSGSFGFSTGIGSRGQGGVERRSHVAPACPVMIADLHGFLRLSGSFGVLALIAGTRARSDPGAVVRARSPAVRKR